ncbi:MAG TPA: polyprenol monophosphomannose synthase [Acidimicrobiales bacterium]|nr:polyprenol monophosphomannose synthase [Acidimicrobiales bacterium]
MRTLVVLPTYEEADNVREAIVRLRRAVPDADVLVVDDNSPDGTADVAKAVAEELGRVEVSVRAGKGGLGSAYRHGFELALQGGYDAIVQMDADLSWSETDLPAMLALLDRGTDLVIGSRYVPGGSIPHWPWHRRAMSRYGNRYACFVLGLPIHDATSGFRVLRASALEANNLFATRSRGYGFMIETAYRMHQGGASMAEVPVTFVDRVRGESKLSLGVAVEELALATGWGLRDLLLRRRRRSSR